MTTIHQVDKYAEDRICQLESKVEKLETVLHKLFGKNTKKTIDKSKIAFEAQMRALIEKHTKNK